MPEEARRPLIACSFKTDPEFDSAHVVYRAAYGVEWHIDNDWLIDFVMLMPADCVEAVATQVNLREMEIARVGTLGFPLAPRGLQCDSQPVDEFVCWLLYPTQPTALSPELIEQINLAVAQGYWVIVDIDNLPTEDPLQAIEYLGQHLSATTFARLVLAWRPIQDFLLQTPDEVQATAERIRKTVSRRAGAAAAAQLRILLIDESERIKGQELARYLLQPDISGIVYLDTWFDTPIEAARLAHKIVQLKRGEA